MASPGKDHETEPLSQPERVEQLLDQTYHRLSEIQQLLFAVVVCRIVLIPLTIIF